MMVYTAVPATFTFIYSACTCNPHVCIPRAASDVGAPKGKGQRRRYPGGRHQVRPLQGAMHDVIHITHRQHGGCCRLLSLVFVAVVTDALPLAFL